MEKTSEKPKRGRPPVAEPLKKRFFRCTDAEWEAICEVAADGNRSQIIRSLIVAEIARLQPDDHSNNPNAGPEHTRGDSK